MKENCKKPMHERLRNGENVKCPKCNKGILVPYNTTYDKAHCYECSNKCNYRIYVEGVINIE